MSENKELLLDEFIQRMLKGADEYVPDTAGGFGESLLSYDVSPYQNLKFARIEINEVVQENTDQSIRHCINCVNQLKRAIDGMMNIFFDRLGLLKIIEKLSWKFPKKLKFLVDLGVLQSQLTSDLNILRNKVEHDFSKPNIDEVKTYYENTWLVVKNLKLHLQIMHIFNNIEFSMDDTYFCIKCARNIAGFEYSIGWKDKKLGTVIYKGQKSQDEYVKIFRTYWQIIELYSFQDIESFKDELIRLVNNSK
ncbi:hypothetical protein [Lactiplantibacillus carotarum]|uniref:hypothetical protein n=1 Tax=Lactiplantibacillus carotarum TaxID=2993456 RepID=UPI00298EE364|nr:hypothetical protein [Lactiplantibacillus carotarum]